MTQGSSGFAAVPARHQGYHPDDKSCSHSESTLVSGLGTAAVECVGNMSAEPS
jgi:hypothetical protein